MQTNRKFEEIIFSFIQSTYSTTHSRNSKKKKFAQFEVDGVVMVALVVVGEEEEEELPPKF